MQVLSTQAFAQARAYLMQHGRTLDQALFAYHFEDAPVGHLLTELAAYQNEDGGFGRGLEPDIRTTASSAIATSEAFQLLRRAGLPQHPVAERAIAYLLRTYDEHRQRWEIVPPAVEDAPHAPWWTYTESEKNFHGFAANPRAAILGHLYDYAAYVPSDLIAELTQVQLDHLSSLPDKMEMHDFLCYRFLAETQSLSEQVRERIIDKLLRAARQIVATERSAWTNYGMEPLGAVPTPDSPIAAALPPAIINDNLDYWIETQQPDGSWPLPWSWAFVDSAAWQQAEKDWKGRIIVDRLSTLAAYGRVSR